MLKAQKLKSSRYFLLNNYTFKNRSSTNAYRKINNLYANEIINKTIRYMKPKFGIEDISIKNHQILNICWMPKMHKDPIKIRFMISVLSFL